MEKQVKLTELEIQVLSNILNSEYQGGEGKEVINQAVWSFSVTNEKKDLAGALGSCVKKGYAVCDKDDGDEVCWITEEGYRVYRQYVIGF